MTHDFMNADLDLEREVETQPEDEAKRLENHIMAESFKLDSIDINKIERQTKELDSLED